MTAPSTLRPTARRRATPPEPPDPITQYALDVVAGRIVAGRLIHKAAERHLADLAGGPDRGLRFDVGAAMRAVQFFHLLRHYKGELGPRGGELGQPIRLEPWQIFIVGSAFGWKRADGTRRFRKVYCEVAKKNGKTLMAAGVALLLAFFDDEPGAEVYSLATKRDQAKLVWNDGDVMTRKNPDLAQRIKKTGLSLHQDSTASKFMPLGQDSDIGEQGVNPHGAIVDELHVLENRDTVDNIGTAMASRRQPMLWEITTAGVKRESIWAEERADAVAILEGRATDDSVFAVIYTLDEGDDPFDEAVWPKANPNLGVSVYLTFLQEQSAQAQRAPGRLAAFLRFHCNVPTAVATRAISIEEWDLCDPRVKELGRPLSREEVEWAIPDGTGGYGGLDLASVRDLCAFILLFRDEDGVYDLIARFWCPEEGITERSRRDGVPYADWVRDGYLTATPGNVTDYAFIRAELNTLGEKYLIGEIGADAWNAVQLAVELGQDGAAVVPIRQTHAGLAPAWRETEKQILEHKLRHGGNPVLRWMAGNVEVVTDAAGNQKPDKAHSSERIDGIVGVCMAMNRWLAHGAAPGVWTAA